MTAGTDVIIWKILSVRLHLQAPHDKRNLYGDRMHRLRWSTALFSDWSGLISAASVCSLIGCIRNGLLQRSLTLFSDWSIAWWAGTELSLLTSTTNRETIGQQQSLCRNQHYQGFKYITERRADMHCWWSCFKHWPRRNDSGVFRVIFSLKGRKHWININIIDEICILMLICHCYLPELLDNTDVLLPNTLLYF